MAIKDFVTELAQVRSVSPKPYVERSQQRQLAELHRGTILKAELLQVNNALMRLAELVYLESADGELDNIDPATGRIVIAKPWGSRGREYFGLSRRVADTLRRCLLYKPHTKRPLLFLYDANTRDWFVNLSPYPNLQTAMFWVKYEAINLSEWRQAGNEVRSGSATRRRDGGS